MGMNEASCFKVVAPVYSDTSSNLEHVYFQERTSEYTTCMSTYTSCESIPELIARVKLKRNSSFLSRENENNAQFRENDSKVYWNRELILKGNGVQQAFLKQFQKVRSVLGFSLETKPLLEFS